MPRSEHKLEDLAKAVVKAADKRKERRGVELAERVNKELGTSYDGRGIGRAIALAVKQGKLKKQGVASRPVYVKT